MPLRADELQLPRAGIQRSGWSPGIRVRRLEEGYRGLQEKSCSSKAKNGRKNS
jgi:hypothetical protein